MTLFKPRSFNLTIKCTSCGKTETKTIDVAQENLMPAQLEFAREFAKTHKCPNKP